MPLSANSAKIILEIIRLFAYKLYTVNIHFFKEPGIREFEDVSGLEINNLDAFPTVARFFKENQIRLELKDPIFIAPDRGSMRFVKSASQSIGWPFGFLEKIRVSGDTVERPHHNIKTIIGEEEVIIDIKGKDVIILDDMIAGGSTTISAAQICKEKGANKIYAAAIHGIFALRKGETDRYAKYEGLLDGVFSTNTIISKKSVIGLEKLIASFIKEKGFSGVKKGDLNLKGIIEIILPLISGFGILGMVKVPEEKEKIITCDDVIAEIKKSNGLYYALLSNNPQAIELLERRVRYLIEEVDLIRLIRNRLKNMIINKQIKLNEEELDDLIVVLFGDFFWHSQNDRPNDLDILIITPQSNPSYRGKWYLSERIPHIALNILSREYFQKNLLPKENLSLLLLGTGVIIFGNKEVIEGLKIKINEEKIINWCNNLIKASWLQDSLGDLGDERKAWKRFFDAYIYIRPVLFKYLSQEEIKAFEDRVFGMDFNRFYQNFFLGKLEELPWRKIDFWEKIWDFRSDLERLIRKLKLSKDNKKHDAHNPEDKSHHSSSPLSKPREEIYEKLRMLKIRLLAFDLNDTLIILEILEKMLSEPKSYPAKLKGEISEPTKEQLENLKLYFKTALKYIVFVDKTSTGKVADINTIPHRIAILKGLACRAPPFDLSDSQSQAFQILVNDILRHELKELEISSHQKALKTSYGYFRIHPRDLDKLLEAIHRFGIQLDEDYQIALLKIKASQNSFNHKGLLFSKNFFIKTIEEWIKAQNRLRGKQLIDKIKSILTEMIKNKPKEAFKKVLLYLLILVNLFGFMLAEDTLQNSINANPSAVQSIQQTSQINLYQQIIHEIKDYYDNLSKNNPKAKRAIQEGVINYFLYKGLASQLGYRFFSPESDLKGKDYFERLTNNIRVLYPGCLILDGHLNANIPKYYRDKRFPATKLLFFFKDNAKNYIVTVDRKGKVISAEYKGVISNLLEIEGTAVFEFSTLEGFFNLSYDAFIQRINEMKIILDWYLENHPAYKNRDIVFVPGHGGLNYLTSHYISSKGKCVGTQLEWSKVFAKKIAKASSSPIILDNPEDNPLRRREKNEDSDLPSVAGGDQASAPQSEESKEHIRILRSAIILREKVSKVLVPKVPMISSGDGLKLISYFIERSTKPVVLIIDRDMDLGKTELAFFMSSGVLGLEKDKIINIEADGIASTSCII